MFQTALFVAKKSTRCVTTNNVVKFSPSIQRLFSSASSPPTSNKMLDKLNVLETSMLLKALNICSIVCTDKIELKLDGMCLSLLESQSDLEDLSITIPNIKFRALQKHLENFQTDGVPLELIDASLEDIVKQAEYDTVEPKGEKIESTSLLSGFAVYDFWKGSYVGPGKKHIEKGDHAFLLMSTGTI
jgi:hypothetical protein